MSKQAVAWARKVKVGSRANRLALLALAQAHPKDVEEFCPHPKTVLDASGLTWKAFEACCRRLAASGLIGRDLRLQNGVRRYSYRLAMTQTASRAWAETEHCDAQRDLFEAFQ